MTAAVILAAGRGTRLRDVVKEQPKGFLKLGSRPIIEESLERLMTAGINDIVIVTGYCAEFYEDLASRYGDVVRTVHNERYAESGSMYSLFCARDVVAKPFLLLESDLIYESRALTFLLDYEAEDAILLSGPTNAGDEVYVETRDGFLVGMSKDPGELDGGSTGELVGITKVSQPLFERMVNIAGEAFENSLMFDYETDCLVAAGREMPIACPLVEDLLWAEIDDTDHLQRARESVYPKISGVDQGAGIV